MDWLSFLKIMGMEERAAQAKYQLAVDLATDADMKSFFARLLRWQAIQALASHFPGYRHHHVSAEWWYN